MSLRSGDALSKLCSLIVQRRSDLMKDFHEGLLKSAIFKAGNIGGDIKEILCYIRKVGLEHFPLRRIEEILKDLSRNGTISRKGDRYFLRETEFKEFAGIFKRRREALEKVNSEISVRMRRKGVSDKNLKAARKVFQSFVHEYLYAESNLIADVLSYRKEVHEASSPLEIFDSALDHVNDANLKRTARRVIIGILTSPDNREFIRVIYEAVLNLTCLRILSDDTSGTTLKRDDLSGKTFILDTNVLFPLLIPDHPLHVVTSRIVSIAEKLGVKCVFTKRTMREWFEVLEKANRRFRFLNSTRPSLLKEVEDIFIYSYFRRKNSDPSLTWSEYYSQLKNVESLAKLSGILLYEEKEEYTSDAEGLKIIEHLSADVYRSGRRRLDMRFIKSRTVSEHDAYHLLLVRRLREESPSRFPGLSYWFLTYDSSLLEADRALSMLLGSPHAAPSSLLVDTWVLMAALFSSSRSEMEGLAEIFTVLFRNYFAAPPKRLSASMVVDVLSPYLSYQSLSDDDLRAVLDDKRIKRLYFRLREARSASSEKARLIYDKLRRRVENTIWKLLERRTKEMGKS